MLPSLHNATPRRTLVVGDIHGCFDELQELICKAGLTADDAIISLGDFVDRGPASPRTLEFFRSQPNARALAGNHERKHVRSFRGEIQPALSQRLSRDQFGASYEAAVDFLATLPCFIETPEAVLVHAFFEPGVPLAEQSEEVLCGTSRSERYIKTRYTQRWYEHYDGARPLIFGHRDHLRTGAPLIWRDRVFGIDTSCCRGGTLTGIVLPSFRIVDVNSRRNYWGAARAAHRSSRGAAVVPRANTPGFSLPAERREQLLQRLYAHAVRERDRIEALLVATDPGFAARSSRQQGQAYAALLCGHALEGLIQKMRRGELSLEVVQRHFHDDAELLRTATERGLA